MQQVERIGAPGQQPRNLARQDSRQNGVFPDQSPVKQSNGKGDQKIIDEDNGTKVQRNMSINDTHGDYQQQHSRKARHRVLVSPYVNRSLLLQLHYSKG